MALLTVIGGVIVAAIGWMWLGHHLVRVHLAGIPAVGHASMRARAGVRLSSADNLLSVARYAVADLDDLVERTSSTGVDSSVDKRRLKDDIETLRLVAELADGLSPTGRQRFIQGIEGLFLGTSTPTVQIQLFRLWGAEFSLDVYEKAFFRQTRDRVNLIPEMILVRTSAGEIPRSFVLDLAARALSMRGDGAEYLQAEALSLCQRLGLEHEIAERQRPVLEPLAESDDAYLRRLARLCLDALPAEQSE